MISLFQVKVTKREEGKKDEKFIRNLHKGDFFGEKALQGYVDIINGTHTVFPQIQRIFLPLFPARRSGRPTSWLTTPRAWPAW